MELEGQLPNGLPKSWTVVEVCESLGLSLEQVAKLLARREVSCFIGKRRTRRMTADHVRELLAVLEKKRIDERASTGEAYYDALIATGVTQRSARIRANKAYRNGQFAPGFS